MPSLYECCMSGDADKLFCSLEEGDSVNSVVSQYTIIFQLLSVNMTLE